MTKSKRYMSAVASRDDFELEKSRSRRSIKRRLRTGINYIQYQRLCAYWIFDIFSEAQFIRNDDREKWQKIILSRSVRCINFSKVSAKTIDVSASAPNSRNSERDRAEPEHDISTFEIKE
jgi:hypothetical protein